MKIRKIATLLGSLSLALLVAVFFLGAIANANPATITVGDGFIADLGSTTTVNITLEEAPNGLSGYNITVSLSDPSIAEIMAVQFPSWATMNDNSTLPADSFWMKAVDLNHQVESGATNIDLGTLTIRGDAKGECEVNVTISRVDDDNGTAISPSVSPGTLRVGQYTLTMAVSGNGTTTPTIGGHTYATGTVVDITATPDTYWYFVNWTGDVANNTLASTSVTVDANKTVTANFAQVNYTLTMAVNGNGNTTPAIGDHSYANGTVMDITATPDTYWHFVNWTGNVSTIGNVNSSTTTINMAGNYSIVANFAIDRYDLNITSSDGGNVSTPGEGTYTYNYSEVVDLVATPDANYHFVNWTGDTGTIGNVSAATTNITMTGNYSIVANFAIDRYDLNITSSDGGNVSTPGEGTYTYNYSEVVNLVATPDANYHFVNWTGDVGTIADVNSSTTNVTMDGNYSITANFELAIIPLPGQTNPPTDRDGDGLYEDFNGNGDLDFSDIVLFFHYKEWIVKNEPIPCFDFNGNGRIDFADIVKLFEMI